MSNRSKVTTLLFFMLAFAVFHCASEPEDNAKSKFADNYYDFDIYGINRNPTVCEEQIYQENPLFSYEVTYCNVSFPTETSLSAIPQNRLFWGIEGKALITDPAKIYTAEGMLADGIHQIGYCCVNGSNHTETWQISNGCWEFLRLQQPRLSESCISY
jgi:hypothetical protein